MSGNGRRNAPEARKTSVKEKAAALAIDEAGEDSVIVVDDSSLKEEISHLRGRWELACVLNFLSVFEPVIGNEFKLTAEEIETGLVRPNVSLSKLHIMLLKGIPPVSKTLNVRDSWVTVLCKKLAPWWPWVAEGEIPLTAAKGEEISKYKEIDPVDRLLLLKALCEIRADQDDVVSYINDSLKNGTGISPFRKEKTGGDGNATSYWFDGNTVIGHRLYKEVSKNVAKTKVKRKASKNLPEIYFHWETIATNLEEFRNVVDSLSSSKIAAEVAIGKAIETDTLPVVEKLYKKREMALKRKQRQEKLLNDTIAYRTGITRSCRNRRQVTYTFDEYDRAIDEAIEVSRKRKVKKDDKNEMNHIEQGNTNSNEGSDAGADMEESDHENNDSDVGMDSKDGTVKNGDPSGSDAEDDRLQDAGNEEGDDSDDDYNIKRNDDSGDSLSSSEEEMSPGKMNRSPVKMNNAPKHVGSRWSGRLAGITGHSIAETRNLGAKNRLRQRPTRNSALDSIVPDSEEENSSDISEHED